MTSDSTADKAVTFDTTGMETLARRSGTASAKFLLAGVNGNRKAGQLAAKVAGGQLVIANEPDTSPCERSTNRLESDLLDLALQLPATMTPGKSWTDSLVIDVCLGGSAGIARTARHFVVVGDTAVGNVRVVVLSRRDSTTLAAKGLLDQHPAQVRGTATAVVLLYVSEATGAVLRVSKEQILLLSVVAEGHARRFAQRLSSTLELLR